MTIFDLLKSSNYPQKPILEKIVCHATGLTKTQLFSHTEQTITNEQQQLIDQMYHRYFDRKEPLEYILGYVEFAKLRFLVSKATIIPRPETEYMIEAVREYFADPTTTKPVTLIDVGTGSGILGIGSMYYENDHITHAYLTDLSADALVVAQQNKEALLASKLQDNVTILHCSLLDHPTIKNLFQSSTTSSDTSSAILQDTSPISHCTAGPNPLYPQGAHWSLKEMGSFKSSDSSSDTSSAILLVANLPYIPDEMFANNADERITTREPTMAFVGGNDGLDLYRQMFDQIIAYRESPLAPLSQRGERFDLFDKEQLQKRGLTRTGGHQPYNANLKQRAQLMRKHMTYAEKVLWKGYLQTCGKTVQRQKIVDHFILDFYIASHRLAIEVDGFSHQDKDAQEYDAYRTRILQSYGIRLIRFTNEEVTTNLTNVIQHIEETYHLPLLTRQNQSHPSSPLWERGAGGDSYPPSHTTRGDSYPPSHTTNNHPPLTMYLEMMTRQLDILKNEYSKHFTFNEVKTFHANIRILQVTDC